MVLGKNRGRFDSLSLKVGKVFSKIGLSPNMWTLLSIVFALLTFYFILQGRFLIVSILFLITAFLDFVDGSVARFTKTTSNVGAYIDTVMDRYVEGIILFGLLFAGLPSVFAPAYVWIFLLFFGGLMTTYVKAAGREKGVLKEELRGGLLERGERMTLLFLGFVLAIFSRVYLSYMVVLLAVLANLSALERIYSVLKSRKG